MNPARSCDVPHGGAPLIHAAPLRLSSAPTQRICFAVVSRLECKQPVGETCPSHSGEIDGITSRRGGQTVSKWEARTDREADADGGSEGPWDEFALVVLNQQGGLAHPAVPHQNSLQRESPTD